MSFDRFWSAYPRHVAKGAALKAWEKINPDEEMTQRIVLAIQAQKQWRWKMEELNGNLPERQKRFVPDWKHPATWLNQACWDDELPSFVEEKIKSESHADLCQCGEKAFNRHQCARCYTKTANPGFADEIKQNLRNMGFTKSKDENWREASMRCLKTNALKLPRFERD